jgi:hypothetical protein
MPAFAGMTLDGRWVEAHAGCYKVPHATGVFRPLPRVTAAVNQPSSPQPLLAAVLRR